MIEHARRAALLPLAALLAALPAAGQEVGSRVVSLPLVDFAGTQAISYEEFVGRAVLIEYFAYW